MFVTNIGTQVLMRNNGNGLVFTDTALASGLEMS
jgi:hypothetical protein